MNKIFIFLIFCITFSITLLCLTNKMYAQPVIEEDKFQISGFMSMRYMKLDFASIETASCASYSPNLNDNGGFWQSNLNLYFIFNPIDDWTAFSEIRFNYAPAGDYQMTRYDMDGDDLLDTYDYTNPMTGDTQPLPLVYGVPNNTSHTDRYFYKFNHGSIYIERSYIEWNRYNIVNIRAGKYITPFGIFNQDHGEPATISIRVPLLVSPPEPYYGMPLSQTGVEIFGNFFMPFDTLMKYSIYVGNGVNSAESEADPSDENSALGGFLNFLLPPIADNIHVETGVSGYHGKRSFILYKTFKITPGIALNEATDDPTDTSQYAVLSEYPELDRYTTKQMETAGLAHLKITIRSLPLGGTFVLQAEGLYQTIDMDNDNRIIDPLTKEPLTTEKFDYSCYYIQGEYQFFGKLTPYFRYDSLHKDTKDPLKLTVFKHLYVRTFGLNFKPDAKLSIKVEWNNVNISTPLANINNDFDIYCSSVSLAF